VTAPEQPPAPSVSTAPAEGSGSSAVSPDTPLRRRRLPAHVGPARTSTVLLAVAFLAIGVLYLFVKPPPPSEAADPGTGSSSTTRSSDPTTEAPASSAPTSTAPTTSESEVPAETPTTEATTTPAEEPPDTPVETTPETTAPEETTAPTSDPDLPTAEPTA